MVAAPPPREYDSDSEDEGEYDSDDVILAFCDGPIPSTSAVTLDATVSQLGGTPHFWPCLGPPYKQADDIVCTICARLLALVCQLYIPTAEAEDRHRALYVFACLHKECQKQQGCVRAFTASRWDTGLAADSTSRRAAEQKKVDDEAEAQERAKTPVNPFSANGASLFGADANNPFSTSTLDASLPAPSTNDDAASEDGSDDSEPLPIPPAPITEEPWSPSAPSLPAFYLDTSYEPAPPPAPSTSTVPTAKTTPVFDTEEMKKTFTAAEAYESFLPAALDAQFLAFTARVARPGCATQVVRTASTPLPFSPEPVEPADRRCGICGTERRFEAQVMPHAVGVLEKGCREAEGEEMGWSTALIWTCPKAECASGREGDERGVWLEEGVRLQYE